MTTLRSDAPVTHMIVLPGGGYAEHTAHEAEPVTSWLGEIGVPASVFRYPVNVRHPAPLDALRAEIARRRAAGAERIGLIGFSAGGHLAGLAALAPGAAPDQTAQFAVLGYAITSMQTQTYRPARLILLGEHASPALRRSTSLDALPVLRDLLPAIRVRVHIFAAADDPLVPVSNGTYLAERIPGSELTILPAAHFAWEEVPDQFAAIIADLVTRTETEWVRPG